MGMGISKVGLTAALISLTGCTTAQNSIFRSFDLDDGRSIATDASQRIVINTKTHPTSRPGRVNPERIVCAEPSPDVASIVANTFGIGLNVLGKGNAALAGGQGTALAQLAERTITVQLLRDQMYRACEAYANGAISGTEYSLLMSRNNDAMVTLMLGETASRTVGRQLAALSAEASSDASATMPNIAEMVKDLAEKKTETDKAEKELDAAKTEQDAANDDVQDTDQNSSDAATDNAEDAANDAAADVDDKEDKAGDAREEEEEALEELIKATAKNTVDTNTTAGGFPAGLPAINKEAVDLAEQLGRMQKEYLDQGAEEHMISACIVELGKAGTPMKADVNSLDLMTPLRRAEFGPGLFARRGSQYRRETENARATSDEETRGVVSQANLAWLAQVEAEIAEIEVAIAGKQSKLMEAIRTKESEATQFSMITQISGLQRDLEEAEREFNAAKDAVFQITYEEKKSRIDEEIHTPEEWAFENYYYAQDQEQTNFFSRTGRRHEIADDRLRAYFAIHDRDSLTVLAQACARWLPHILENQGRTERRRLAFSLLTDLERIRAREAHPPKQKPTDKPKDDKKKPKTASEYVADYIACDKKSKPADQEICRVKIVDAMVRGTDVKPVGSPDPLPAPNARVFKKGDHVIVLSSTVYKKADKAKTKKALEAEWTAIKKKHEALLKGKKHEIFEEKSSANKLIMGLRIGPYDTNDKAKKFCTDSKRPDDKCKVVKLKK